METLSVITPAHNAEKYLAESVGSIRCQNWPGDVNVIIIDDGSTDGTLSLAHELGDLVLTKTKGGAASARNAGLREATGDFVFLLDADDKLTDGALEALYAEFLKDPDLMGCFGLARDFISPELTEEEKKGLSAREKEYTGILPGCALLRREVFNKVGLFDENLGSGETVAWMLKLRESGLKTTHLDIVTLDRRIHMTNTGRTERGQEMKNYAAIIRQRMAKK